MIFYTVMDEISRHEWVMTSGPHQQVEYVLFNSTILVKHLSLLADCLDCTKIWITLYCRTDSRYFIIIIIKPFMTVAPNKTWTNISLTDKSIFWKSLVIYAQTSFKDFAIICLIHKLFSSISYITWKQQFSGVIQSRHVWFRNKWKLFQVSSLIVCIWNFQVW